MYETWIKLLWRKSGQEVFCKHTLNPSPELVVTLRDNTKEGKWARLNLIQPGNLLRHDAFIS